MFASIRRERLTVSGAITTDVFVVDTVVQAYRLLDSFVQDDLKFNRNVTYFIRTHDSAVSEPVTIYTYNTTEAKAEETHETITKQVTQHVSDHPGIVVNHRTTKLFGTTRHFVVNRPGTLAAFSKFKVNTVATR